MKSRFVYDNLLDALIDNNLLLTKCYNNYSILYLDRKIERRITISQCRRVYLDIHFPNWRVEAKERGCCSLCVERAYELLISSEAVNKNENNPS